MKLKLLPPLLLLLISVTSAQTDFSEENALAILSHLCVEIGPRPMGSPAEGLALQFAVEKFKEYGCDTSYLMKMNYTTRSNTSSGIAVGIKRGASKRMIVIGGHIDSSSPENPGANDDGSGSAVVIEASRVLLNKPHRSTLVFCCFGGEEQGLQGSTYFVNNFPEMDSVALMLQVDMANGLGTIDLLPDTRRYSAPSWLVKALVEEFYSLGYDNLRYPTHFFTLNYAGQGAAGSDHESFLEKGVPAIDLTTDPADPIHTPLDNMQYFRSAGMKRSGDIILRLAGRFDKGTPGRSLEQYWLMLIWKTPIFIPIWGIWMFVLIVFLLSGISVLAVRRRRLDPNAPGWIKWSGLKMLFFSLILVAFGWFSSDLVGLIKGVRYPWFTPITQYIFLAIISSFIGLLIVLRITGKLRLSLCPYVFFKRAVIMLAIFTLLASFINPKATVEPAAALLLASLAILFGNPLLKVMFAALSPIWMLRMIFSEWSSMLFREIAIMVQPGILNFAVFDILPVFLIVIYLLPFLLTLAAVIRDSAVLKSFIPALRSAPVLIFALAALGALSAYLLTVPAYRAPYCQRVNITQKYDINENNRDVKISSADHLKGLIIAYGDTQFAVNSRRSVLQINPAAGFDTSWLKVDRHVISHQGGNSASYRIDLLIAAKFRPFTVKITYSEEAESLREEGARDTLNREGGTPPFESELQSFYTPYKFSSQKKDKVIEWYSFPDSLINVPVSFEISKCNTVTENIEVTFDRLAYPVKCEGSDIYLISRTVYTSRHVYFKSSPESVDNGFYACAVALTSTRPFLLLPR